MSEITPYAAPQTEPNPQQPLPQQGPPEPIRSAVPKVFGILHIIYGGLGLCIALASLMSDKIMKLMPQVGGNNEAIMKLANEYTESIKTYTYIDIIFRVGLSVLIILAGRQLLNYKRAGVQMTKTFFIIRVVEAVGLTLLMRGPMVDYFNEISKIAGITLPLPSLAFQLIIGLVFVSIYPIVALIILTRPNVQKDLS